MPLGCLHLPSIGEMPVYRIMFFAFVLFIGVDDVFANESSISTVPTKIIGHTEHLSCGLRKTLLVSSAEKWNKDAVWDEYELDIYNPTDEIVFIESIWLLDHREQRIASQSSPQLLREETMALVDQYKQDAAITTLIQASPMLLGTAAVAVGSATAVGAAVVMAPVAVIAAPLYMLIANQSNQGKADLEREFDKRSLFDRTSPSPVKALAKRTLSGSAFFPVVPLPQKLVLAYSTKGGVQGKLELILPSVVQNQTSN